jgi:hypothetical protein
MSCVGSDVRGTALQLELELKLILSIYDGSLIFLSASLSHHVTIASGTAKTACAGPLEFGEGV